MTLSALELLGRFHEQIRLRGPDGDRQPGVIVDRAGPVRRRYPEQPGESYSMVECPEGLGEDPDRWIARVVDFFTARAEKVEWKTYSMDQPADLGERLVAHGFVKEDDEALVLGEVAGLVQEVRLPGGVRLREVAAEDGATFRRIHALMALVWEGVEDANSLTEQDFSQSMTNSLMAEKVADPAGLDVFVIEREDTSEVLCAAWLRASAGTDFASLWGGSTHPDWRRRGLYRATVAARARRARERGYRLMRVDCSPDSRPILTGLGLLAVATTTPYVLDARAAVDSRAVAGLP